MLEITEDPRRVEVWAAMADHFLDTETRHDIPLTARRCIVASGSTRCVEALTAAPSAGERDRLLRRFTFLARHYFDFCPVDPAAIDRSEMQKIRSLYPEPFVYIMEPALIAGEARLADERVRAALGRAPS